MTLPLHLSARVAALALLMPAVAATPAGAHHRGWHDGGQPHAVADTVDRTAAPAFDPELRRHLDEMRREDAEDARAVVPAPRPAPRTSPAPRRTAARRTARRRTAPRRRPALRAAAVPYGPLIALVARRRGVPPALLTALVWQESGFRASARSRAGARGLTQLMPATARMLGVRRILDPVQNLDGGARYLAGLLRAFRSKRLALAGYNAGPGAVRRFGGIPPYAETQRYVVRVLAIERQLRRRGLR